MNRRDFLSLMIASGLAESLDWERLLWIPKPIITVPAMPVMPQMKTLAEWGLRFSFSHQTELNRLHSSILESLEYWS